MDVSSASKLRSRQPLVAAVLSSVLPGLGQLYNGEVNKAAWFLMAFTLFSVPAVGLSLLYLPAHWSLWTLVGFTTLSLCVWLASIIQAFRQAYRMPKQRLSSWQGAGVYLLVALLVLAVAAPLLNREVRTRMIDVYLIPSASMEPTLIAGDYILADMRYNCLACNNAVQRGDIALFVYPNDRTVRYVKRVIGLPGDRVQLKGEALRVNGQLLSGEPVAQTEMDVVQEQFGDNRWVVVWRDRVKAKRTDVDVTVPPGKIFVLGDNRTNSNDSRFFGPVPLEDVFGRARQIVLSYQAERHQLWPGRSGRALHPTADQGFWTELALFKGVDGVASTTSGSLAHP